jgi:hypothetical protein
MTELARTNSLPFHGILVVACPFLSQRMKAMGAAVESPRLTVMAAGALGNRACVILQLERPEVVVQMRTWILRVSGVMTGGTLQAAVPA